MELPLEKLAIRMWDTVAEKGIGSLFKPWQMRREGKVSIELKREELLMIAQAERDAELIRRGERLPSFVRNAGHSQGDSAEEVNFGQLVSATVVADAVRKEANVARALLHAEEALGADTQEPPSESVDDDWLFRWRDSASHVSSEELQNLWGRVLAGEVKSPGSFSLRTLDFLKSISRQEAEAISVLSRFIIGNAIYRVPEQELKEFDLKFEFFLSMQQLGLISGVEAVGMQTTWKSNDKERFSQILTSHGMVLVVSGDDPSRTISMPTYQVTPIGAQVMQLGKSESNVSYLRKVGLHLKNQGMSVTLAPFVRTSPTTITWFSGEVL